MKRALFALLLLLPAAFASAQQQPAFATNGNAVTIALPASVLQHAAVRKQLGSGLTTTFIVIARSRDRTAEGGARVEVRYDLWDEIYHVRRFEAGRRIDQQRIESLEKLEQWWRTPSRIISLNGQRIVLDVELRVLPFSGAEEEDARRWLSLPDRTTSLVDVLIGTTISAKPIVSFRWSAEVVRR
ncbi:MAG TPA: hypothetical protein VF618_04010 [Thermoanaerobaculia bacterium]